MESDTSAPRSVGEDGLEARAIAEMAMLERSAYEHQRLAFRAQENNRDLLLCAATGDGKSYTYQAAAYASPGTLTIVISPGDSRGSEL